MLSGIELTDACRLTEESDVHPENTPVPREATLPGTVIVVREVHPSNAPPPIDVTVDGIVTLVIFVFPLNTFASIAVTVSGMVMAPPEPE